MALAFYKIEFTQCAKKIYYNFFCNNEYIGKWGLIEKFEIKNFEGSEPKNYQKFENRRKIDSIQKSLEIIIFEICKILTKNIFFNNFSRLISKILSGIFFSRFEFQSSDVF